MTVKNGSVWKKLVLLLLINTALVFSAPGTIKWTNKQPTSNPMGKYKNGAVSTVDEQCAKIGVKMLEKGGSAVDAAIATLICECVVSSHAMGMGGGFSMTIWDAKKKEVFSLDARETAPRQATTDMFRGNAELASRGGLAVAVPGEVMGYWEAHQKFGKLNWNELFEPSIELCEQGFRVNHFLHYGINATQNLIRAQPSMAEIFINPQTNQPFQLGDTMKRPLYGRTLRKLSAPDGSGVKDFYNGTMARDMVREIKRYNGIIDEQDFRDYRVLWRSPVQTKLKNGLTVYSSPLPGSGSILTFILNVLDGFVFEKGETIGYQRILETFKWAYSFRTEIGDPAFLPRATELAANLTDKEQAKFIRRLIDDKWTSNDPDYYGADTYDRDDHGTYHGCIYAPDGSAVSVTSTINGLFGAFFRSESTGIIFNNEMDDFSAPNIINIFGVRPSPANYIQPGKRPLSSTAPTIMVDQKNQVRLLVGGVGGIKITTGVALTSILHLWAGYSIKEAIDANRIHHQFLPMEAQIENNFPLPIKKYLSNVGHNITDFAGYPNLIFAISQKNGVISAYSDFRQDCRNAGF